MADVPKRLHFTPSGSFDIERIGLQSSWRHDLYHFLQTASWRKLITLLSGVYLGANVLFALIYLPGLGGLANARPGSFVDAFFFSVQTMSTVGYGYLAPQSLYINGVMVLESLFGFLFTAISTGLIFAKFSRVRARVMFSRVAVIHTQDRQQILTFRAANQRHAEIVDASVKLALTRDEWTEEGHYLRRIYDLPLRRDTSPLFALVWNIIHVIDSSSPLYGQTAESLAQQNTILLLTFSGIDDRLSQTLHTRHAYNHTEIILGERLADIIESREDGRKVVNYHHFHKTEAEVHHK
ncbi:MAG: ion channel [Candidatus Sericytochromatia bacterium]